MTVERMIAQLKKMPKEAKVFYHIGVETLEDVEVIQMEAGGDKPDIVVLY